MLSVKALASKFPTGTMPAGVLPTMNVISHGVQFVGKKRPVGVVPPQFKTVLVVPPAVIVMTVQFGSVKFELVVVTIAGRKFDFNINKHL